MLCMTVFRLEAQRGTRLVGAGWRGQLDRGLELVVQRTTHLGIHFGTGAVRLALHFVIHKALAIMLGGLRWFEKGVALMQQNNRRVAKTIRDEQRKTHLHVIAEHKESSALTEKQKQKLKAQAIE